MRPKNGMEFFLKFYASVRQGTTLTVSDQWPPEGEDPKVKAQYPHLWFFSLTTVCMLWAFSACAGKQNIFTACQNARIASAVLAIAIPSVCLFVRHWYCVKTTAHSMVQFALSDSKMSRFLETKKYSGETTPYPWNLGSNWPTPSKKQWVLTRFALLPCSASEIRDRKRSSITVNKKSTRAFQRAIIQGSTPPLTSSKWG